MRAARHSGSVARTPKRLGRANVCLLAFFLLMVLPGVAGPAPSGSPQPRPVAQNPIRVSVDLVVLHATVQGRGRSSVSGLRKEDFQVYEDKVLQQISSFSHEDIPVTVGLVVDNSGSMGMKHSDVTAAALAFARSSHPKDQMFIVYFNENVSFALPENRPFTDKEAELKVALSRIRADGMTALYDATAAALAHLKNGKWDKQVLVVLSDGADNASKHNLAQLMALAEQSSAVIYTVGLFPMEDPDRNPGVLKKLAKATGGQAFLPQSLKRVAPICEQIARDIRGQYTLTYAPSNTKQDGAHRAIQVKARAPGHGRLSVRTRTGYTVPLKPQPAPAARSLP